MRSGSNRIPGGTREMSGQTAAKQITLSAQSTRPLVLNGKTHETGPHCWPASSGRLMTQQFAIRPAFRSPI